MRDMRVRVRVCLGLRLLAVCYLSFFLVVAAKVSFIMTMIAAHYDAYDYDVRARFDFYL